MRINLIGNVCNYEYVLAKYLRKKGIDAHLFIIKPYHKQYLPESDDPELANGYPDWIEVIDANHFCWSFPFIKHPAYELRLLKKLNDCDIIHASDWGVAYAQFCKKPFTFYCTGAEINLFPYKKFRIDYNRIEVFTRKAIKLRINGIKHSFYEIWGGPYLWLGYLTRLALKKCTFISTVGNSLLTNQSIKYFKVDGKKIIMPILIDGSKFKVNSNRKVSEKSFTVFSSTRHIWNNEYAMLDESDLLKYYDIKGNDKAIRAFARLVKKYSDIKMILIETGINVPESKVLIKKLGIEKNVIWLQHLPRNKLIELYNQADVVFDQFWLGGMGIAAKEVLFCGTPLITYIANDGKLFKSVLGSKPPVLNCKTEDEIYKALLWCYNNREESRALGLKGREWAMKHYDAETNIDKYIKLYERILQDKHISK